MFHDDPFLLFLFFFVKCEAVYCHTVLAKLGLRLDLYVNDCSNVSQPISSDMICVELH